MAEKQPTVLQADEMLLYGLADYKLAGSLETWGARKPVAKINGGERLGERGEKHRETPTPNDATAVCRNTWKWLSDIQDAVNALH